MTRSTAMLLLFIAIMLIAGLISCSSAIGSGHITHDSVPVRYDPYSRYVVFRATDLNDRVHIVRADSAFRQGDLVTLDSMPMLIQERVK